MSSPFTIDVNCHYVYQLYYFIYSYITKTRIHILQKRASRIVTNSNFLQSTDVLYKKLSILKINDLYTFHV